MAMGHRDRLKTGDEYDVIGKWRKIYCYLSRPGVTARVKNAINRRARKAAKKETAREIEG
jgi:hypothetical protein